MPFYDSIRDARVPTWIEESIDTRNTVTVAAGVQEKSERLLKKYCKLYRKDEESFWKGLFQQLYEHVLM